MQPLELVKVFQPWPNHIPATEHLSVCLSVCLSVSQRPVIGHLLHSLD